MTAFASAHFTGFFLFQTPHRFSSKLANDVPISKLKPFSKLIPICNDTVCIRRMGCCRGYIQQDIQTRDFLMAFPITTMTTVYCNNNTGDIQWQALHSWVLCWLFPDCGWLLLTDVDCYWLLSTGAFYNTGWQRLQPWWRLWIWDLEDLEQEVVI